MDFLDEMLSHSPKEKFLQMLQNASPSAVESVMEKLLKEHIALRELLEQKYSENLGQNNVNLGQSGENSGEFVGADEINADLSVLDEQIALFGMENADLVEERLNDYFIGLTAEILGVEG